MVCGSSRTASMFEGNFGDGDYRMSPIIRKSSDRTMTISDIRLMKKSGGKTETFVREK